MPARPPISVVIITLNEEHNLPRCLDSVNWAAEVLVVDSGSKDRTCELARQAGAKVLEHPWEGYGQQKNWAMKQASQPWVFFLDADEAVTENLKSEILSFVAADGAVSGASHSGASFPRKTWFLGRWILHGGWYPNRLVRLARKESSFWTEPAVHEALQVKGVVHLMQNDLLHYTFRNVGDQVTTNIRFSRLGAKVARERGERGSLPRILLKPIGKFLETFLWKLGFLDGFPGFVISMNAAHSIFLKYVELRFAEKNPDHR
ncbi:MAG TPA: glycosyltransferase family 2 protein [Bdellovibrionota bacterium]|jgi:glycosyltransferase involved in cell wall biosynthesis